MLFLAEIDRLDENLIVEQIGKISNPSFISSQSAALRNLMKVSPPETGPSQGDKAWFGGSKSA